MKKDKLVDAIELSKEIISKLDESQLREIEGGEVVSFSCYFFSCSGAVESED